VSDSNREEYQSWWFYTTESVESGTKCAVGAWCVTNLLSNAFFYAACLQNYGGMSSSSSSSSYVSSGSSGINKGISNSAKRAMVTVV
jgi:hypothetical protein